MLLIPLKEIPKKLAAQQYTTFIVKHAFLCKAPHDVFLRTRFFPSSLQKLSGESAEVFILEYTAVSWSESVNISAAFCIRFSRTDRSAVNGADCIKCQV